ncbi:hypothetical protein ABEB36_003475 [Hypothenemus hampei]|uniref:Uncharacterized protein n=1 Tax=Hypothenemus hampei TaxID=57062 RepID=A0ABD1F9C4_HYPHA
MAAVEQSVNNQTEKYNQEDHHKALAAKTAEEVKTVFNILSKLKESDSTSGNRTTETDEDILILKVDPTTNQSTINKSAYLKLHRNLSPSKTGIDKLKKNYEETQQKSNSVETIETLKNKYSPAGLGYNYSTPNPIPKPRKTKSQILTPSKREKDTRRSWSAERNKQKDLNSNNVQDKTDDSSDEEFITIITRSPSVETVLKIDQELSAFTMDNKKKGGFRKLFSVFSNKDKKKKHDKIKSENKQNGDTYENEHNSFNRQSMLRHTTGGESKPNKTNNTNNKVSRSDSDRKATNNYNELQLEKQYAQMYISQLNQYQHNLENTQNGNTTRITPDGYTQMDKPLYKNTTNAYINMPSVNKFIDTSSSASTLESDRSNLYQTETSVVKSNQSPGDDEVEIRTFKSNSFRPNRISDDRRDTPPRLLETQPEVRLVNPKALIPISSERPLPNPYHSRNRDFPMTQNKATSHSSTDYHQNKEQPRVSRQPTCNEDYGTVFDSIEKKLPESRVIQNQRNVSLQKPPRSPSVEATKLKLPSNREIVPLSPRVKSPIPSDNVSTDKIIATELLKHTRSPTPTKTSSEQEVYTHQIDSPRKFHNQTVNSSKENLLSHADIRSKPPISVRPPIMRNIPDELNRSQTSRSSNESIVFRPKVISQTSSNSGSKIITDAQVHTNSPVNRTPTSSFSLSNQNLSLSPSKPTNLNLRPSTPSGSQIVDSPKSTPQKEDMRKSVEAYYWKEIKKLKDQENYELYMMQMQYGNIPPYGYAEDPISVRRSRSMSPLASRNGRSLSLPRETRPGPTNINRDQYYSNMIPENRALVNPQIHPRSMQQIQYQQQQYFQRNTPERSTIDGSPRKFDGNTNSLYRPIFKRGSLSTPPKSTVEDSLKRKVSFSGAHNQNVQSWPTKNGYTQSPPQRRIEKAPSQGDDEVFLSNNPTNPRNSYLNDSNARIDLQNEEMYYNTRQNLIGRPNNEPLYAMQPRQNSLYHVQRRPIENPYGQRVQLIQRRLPNQPEDGLYRQPIDTVRPQISRHGSIQIQEELYGQRPDIRRMSYQNASIQRPSVPSTPISLLQESPYGTRRPASQLQLTRREIIVSDEIFGQFGGYAGQNQNLQIGQPQNIYMSRQSIAEPNYARSPQKRVSVTNRVCDIYGQIHDSDPGTVQQSGVLMGQLQMNNSSLQHQLAGQDGFVRNNRLTASANDMYRRVPPQSIYGRIEQVPMQNVAPNRPLPPVPQKKTGNKVMVRNHFVSDTESGSDASEVQRILNNNSKTKKRGFFGK